MSWILGIMVGAGVGALLGRYGKCASGSCPLTANPWRGALYGVVLGLLFHSALGSGPASGPTANVKLVDRAQFDSEIAQPGRLVVADFFATWCGPCKRLSPILDEVAGPFTNRISFLKVDVDQSSELAAKYAVRGVPTLVFLRNGKEVDRQTGLLSKADLKARLESFVSSPPVSTNAKL